MKYFVVSDVHSFYTPLKTSLKRAGYDINNENHTLVVIGDLFDRGEETIKLFKFIKSIPEDRLVLIRGNHEDLYEKLLTKSFPQQHDVSNGTVKTFFSQQKTWKTEDLFQDTWTQKEIEETGTISGVYDDKPNAVWEDVKNSVSKSKITKFIKDKSKWKNYFEIGPFVLTHSFVPLLGDVSYDCFTFSIQYIPNWRDITDEKKWEQSRWGCPWWNYKRGCWDEEEKQGKTIIVGHWHTHEFFQRLKGDWSQSNKGKIYYTKGLIGIDGGVSAKLQFNKETLETKRKLVHKQNVLIIDEDFNVFDKYGKQLNKD